MPKTMSLRKSRSVINKPSIGVPKSQGIEKGKRDIEPFEPTEAGKEKRQSFALMVLVVACHGFVLADDQQLVISTG